MELDEQREIRLLTCRPGHVLKFVLAQGVDLGTPIGRFFQEGGIDIVVGNVHDEQIRLAISAHEGFVVEQLDLSL